MRRPTLERDPRKLLRSEMIKKSEPAGLLVDQSSREKLLRKQVSGDGQENLCLTAGGESVMSFKENLCLDGVVKKTDMSRLSPVGTNIINLLLGFILNETPNHRLPLVACHAFYASAARGECHVPIILIAW